MDVRTTSPLLVETFSITATLIQNDGPVKIRKNPRFQKETGSKTDDFLVFFKFLFAAYLLWIYVLSQFFELRIFG